MMVTLISTGRIRVLVPRDRNRYTFEAMVENIACIGLKRPVIVSTPAVRDDAKCDRGMAGVPRFAAAILKRGQAHGSINAVPAWEVLCKRTPGPSCGVPMNSMPASSKAFCIACKVWVWLEGMPSRPSILLIVRTEIPVVIDNSVIVHLNAARAARICSLAIIDAAYKWHYMCHIGYLR
jgi:hypothetical protein